MRQKRAPSIWICELLAFCIFLLLIGSYIAYEEISYYSGYSDLTWLKVDEVVRFHVAQCFTIVCAMMVPFQIPFWIAWGIGRRKEWKFWPANLIVTGIGTSFAFFCLITYVYVGLMISIG